MPADAQTPTTESPAVYSRTPGGILGGVNAGLLWRGFGCVLLAALPTCAYLDVERTVRVEYVRSSFVSVAPAGATGTASGATSDQPLAPGEQSIARGTMPLPDGSQTDYEVRAGRGADGAPRVRWLTRVGLASGEYLDVLPAEPAVGMSFDQWTSILRSSVPADPLLRLPGCTYLRQTYGGYRNRSVRGFKVAADLPCAGTAPDSAALFALETPWSNVRTIRERVHYDHDFPWLYVELGAILTAGGTVDLLVGALGETHDPTQKALLLGSGGVLVVTGAVLMVTQIPQLLKRDTERRVYPPSD
jgi:hypothetical protein